MNKIQYNVRFVENMQDCSDISDDEFRLIKNDLKNTLENYLSMAGFKIEGDIELDFDMIGDNDYETWC